MLYITMLRCRQMEKDASFKYYQNRLLQLKKVQKNLKLQYDKYNETIDTNEELNEISMEILNIKIKMKQIEAEIQNNDYQIEIEEENLAREAAMAKERVMVARAAKLSRLNNQTA